MLDLRVFLILENSLCFFTDSDGEFRAIFVFCFFVFTAALAHAEDVFNPVYTALSGDDVARGLELSFIEDIIKLKWDFTIRRTLPGRSSSGFFCLKHLNKRKEGEKQTWNVFLDHGIKDKLFYTELHSVTNTSERPWAGNISTHTNTHKTLGGKQVQINRKRKRQYKHLDGRQLIIKDY